MLEEVAETNEEHLPTSLQNTFDYEPPQFGMTRAELDPNGGRSSAMYHKDAMII